MGWPGGGTLLGWLDDARCDAGVYSRDGLSWRFSPYAELADRARGVSQQLRRSGVCRGDVVAIADAECTDFLSAFIGTIHAGATALPLPSPDALGPRYVEQTVRMMREVSSRLAITSGHGDLALVQSAAHEADGAFCLRLEDVRVSTLKAEDIAPVVLLQATSGSSGPARAIEVTCANLEANVEMINKWLRMRSTDSVASWLPFHHDMGLVGMLIASVCRQTTLWQMRPKEFLANPVSWLECFGAHGATVAAAPNFAYAYVARRVKPDQLEGLDFSDWRSAVAAAERLEAAALAGFADLLAPFGFQPEMLCPAYGLAEATLAVTGHTPGSIPDIVRVRPGAMRPGKAVEVEERGPLTGEFQRGADRVLVTSGLPLPGVEVTVVAEDGSVLPDGTLGEIAVQGPTVTRGYLGYIGDSLTRFEDGKLLTGDAGFLLGRELFVLGRMGESIKVRGRTVYAEGLEIAIAAALSVPVSKCVVVSTQHTASNIVAAIIERPAGDWVADAGRILRSNIGPSVELAVYAAPPGTIPRTTSGKPQRRSMWHQIASGQLDAELALSSASPPPGGCRASLSPVAGSLTVESHAPADHPVQG